MKNTLLLFALLLSSALGISQENTYEIDFKSGPLTLDTTIDLYDALAPQRSERQQEHIYRVVQFRTIPTSIEKKEIETAGIELVSYISNMAYFAKIRSNTSANALKNLNIRSLAAIHPAFKISPALTKEALPEWALSNDMIQLNIKYFSASDMEKVTTFISNNKGRVIFQLKKANAMTIQYKADEIDQLAANPLIQWVEPISPVGVPDDTASNSNIRQNTLNTSYLGGRKYDGTGVVVGLSDDGVVGPHIDTKGRITMQTTTNDGSHGDGTSGVFVAAGNLDPLAAGVAPGAEIQIFSHIPNGSLESHSQIANGEEHLENLNMVITSTSWSQGNAGVYNISTEFGDQQIFDNQNMMHVFSAGNEGERDHEYGAGPGWANITGGYKAGKNVICVGNVGANGILVTTSGRGPASDGRIKPDVCAQGDGTYTTGENNTYIDFGGTSASAPATAGVFTQLYQAYKELNNGEEPETALVKASLLNTAKDMGNPGPDFQHGWGLINGLKAVRILEDRRYIRDEIDQAGNNSHTVSVPENVSEVRIMTYWTEVGGNPSSGIGLVNDIDMQVVSPDAVMHQPWVLDHTPDPALLNADATQGADHVNNVEQVSIKNPQAGDYQVNLDGFAIPEGPQAYYVVYEFIYNAVELTYPIGGEGFVPGEVEIIRWDASEGTEDITLEYSIDGGSTYTLINSAIPNDAVGFDWTVPNEVSGNVSLKISRGDQEDETDTTLAIVDVPQTIEFLRLCPDSIELGWDPVPGATMYEISLLGDKYMDSIGVSNTNTFAYAGLNPLEEHWFSVRSVIDGSKGRRAIATFQTPGIENCNLDIDIAVSQILNNPADFTPCADADVRTVSVLLANAGTSDNISNFEVSYQLNGGDIITEVYPGTLESGEEAVYDFATPLELSGPDLYTLSVFVNLNDDQNEFNNIASLEFRGALTGASIPFEEDFESNGITPSGWSVNNEDEEITWVQKDDIIGIDGSRSTVAFIDNWSYDAAGAEDELITEYFDLSNAGGEVELNFDLAKAQWDDDLNDDLRVEISTDCGDSFTVVYEKEDLVLSTLPNYSNTDQWEPLSGSDWRKENIDLTPYIGEQILIKFVNVTGWGNSTYIDNVNVNQTLVSTKETFISKVNVSPNPANETVNIELSNQVTTNADIVLTNSLGQTVSNVMEYKGSAITMNVSEYASGLYFIVVTVDGVSETKKLIIE